MEIQDSEQEGKIEMQIDGAFVGTKTHNAEGRQLCTKNQFSQGCSCLCL